MLLTMRRILVIFIALTFLSATLAAKRPADANPTPSATPCGIKLNNSSLLN